MKTVPNQKIVKVQKEKCDSNNLYACINLAAMEEAAQDLDAGAFKLWCYFAKNQMNYEFALSSKAVEDTFGIKIKQYNNAIAQLIAKGYLNETSANRYEFKEIAVMTKGNNVEQIEKHVILKGNNDVMTKGNNVVILKGNNTLLPKDIRNITNNTTSNNTITNTTLDFADKPQNPTVEKIIVNYVPKATVKKKPYVKPTIKEVPLWMFEMA